MMVVLPHEKMIRNVDHSNSIYFQNAIKCAQLKKNELNNGKQYKGQRRLK